MSKNKIILISVFFLVIILVLAALLKFVIFKSAVQTQNVNDKAAVGTALTATPEADCRKKSSADERDNCFNISALKHNDIEICSRIADDNLKMSCQNIIVIEQVSRNKKLDICLNISAKDECFAVALGIRDGWSACVQNSNRASCLEKLFTAEAVKQSNSFICNAILNKADCLEKVNSSAIR